MVALRMRARTRARTTSWRLKAILAPVACGASIRALRRTRCRTPALSSARWRRWVSVQGDNEAGGGADIGALRQAGVPVVDLAQDGSDYFDLHHTPNDTLNMIDPAALRQNVAAWATFVYLAADHDWTFRAE